MGFYALYKPYIQHAPTGPFNASATRSFTAHNNSDNTHLNAQNADESQNESLVFEAGQTDPHQRVINLIQQGQPSKAITLLQDLELLALANQGNKAAHDRFKDLLSDVSNILSSSEDISPDLSAVVEDLALVWGESTPDTPEEVIALERQSRLNYIDDEDKRIRTANRLNPPALNAPSPF